MSADQVTFQATLEDSVSPNLEKLEKQLKAMGQSPVQIKMILNAVDNATPKIQQAKQSIDKLPKQHLIHLDVQGGVEKFKEEILRAKQEIGKPIALPFKLVTHTGEDLKQSLAGISQMASPITSTMAGAAGGVMPGGGGLIAGVVGGAGIAGAVGGLTQVFQESIKQNIEIEQAHQKLSVALRDSSGATEELNKVIAANVKTPFTFQSMLQADVLARSFQMPVFAGENSKVPQGYLKTAGNMAAAMGTTPDDAMMALAMARQHMFRRLQPFGIRMTAQDFQGGGRYAGMSVDQALQIATRRYSGAMEAQMKTFSGMMSNVKDVMSQQVMRPVGKSLFSAMESQVGKVEIGLQDPATVDKLGKAVEKVQHLTVTLIQDLQKVHEYFDVHLKKPIEDVINAIMTLGKAFAVAFGGTTATVIKTLSEVIMSITTPMAQIAKSVPQLGSMLGVLKAMSLLHLGGITAPLQTLTNAFNPQSSQGLFTGIFKSIAELPSALIKLGGFLAVKDIADAHKSSKDMNNQFSNMKGNLSGINKEVATMAINLGVSETHMKNLVATAAQGIPQGALSPKARADLAAHVAQGGYQIGKITGMSPSNVVDALSAQMKSANQYSVDALHKFGTQLIETATVAKQFGDSWSQVQQIMTTFAQQAQPIGLGGQQGAPSLIALSAAANQFPVTRKQQDIGLYTGDQVLQEMMQRYKAPTIDQLTQIPKGQLGQYWNFAGNKGAVRNAATDETTFQQQATAAQQLQQSARAKIGQIAPTALQGQYQVPSVPVLWNQQGLATDFGAFGKKGQSPEQEAEKVKQAWLDTEKNYARAKQTIADYQAKVDQTTNTLDQFNQAQAAVNLQMQAFQHTITIQQRVVEDASLALQQYTFDNLRPLERELTRVQNAMDMVNHTMSDAQYNMQKFADGLLTGEQAALNQLHALSLYNEQLNYLKMQYTQIGAQLGTRTYERGYSARVQPLMGLSLEMQMQQLQRKQEMEQAKYNITFGEGHYQMQQAQRSLWQRTEMPLNQRLAGITSNQKVIDQTTIQAHNLGEVQFALQQKMFAVNEVIANQQDHLTKLQLNLTRMQQSSTMRRFEDEQFHLGQEIGKTNQKLTSQNLTLTQWNNTVDDLNKKKQDLQTLFDTLMQFQSGGGKGLFAQDIKMVHVAEKTGLMSKKEGDQFITAIQEAQKAFGQGQKASVNWWTNESSFWKKLRQAIWGVFSGDTFRKLGDLLGKVPVVGGAASTVLHTIGNIMPIATTVVGTMIGTGALAWVIKRSAAHILPSFIKDTPTTVPQVWALNRLGFHGKASEIAGRDSKTVREALTGTLRENIASGFKLFTHPIETIRSLGFRAIFASLGQMSGIPGGGILGGLLGGPAAKTMHGPNRAVWDVMLGGKNRVLSSSEFGKPETESWLKKIWTRGSMAEPMVALVADPEKVPGGRSIGLDYAKVLRGPGALSIPSGIAVKEDASFLGKLKSTVTNFAQSVARRAKDESGFISLESINLHKQAATATIDRVAATTQGKAARVAHNAAGEASRTAKQTTTNNLSFKRTVDEARQTASKAALTEVKNASVIDKFKLHIADFKTNVADFKTGVGDKGFFGGVKQFLSEDRGIGKFGKIISLFAGAVSTFSGLFNGLRSLFPDLNPAKIIPKAFSRLSNLFPHRPGSTVRTLGEVGHDTSSVTRSVAQARRQAASEAAGAAHTRITGTGSGVRVRYSSAGAVEPALIHETVPLRGLAGYAANHPRIAGTTRGAFKIGGAVGAVASLAPGTLDLAHGHTGKGALELGENSIYFIPGFGQVAGLASLATSVSQIPFQAITGQSYRQALGVDPSNAAMKRGTSIGLGKLGWWANNMLNAKGLESLPAAQFGNLTRGGAIALSGAETASSAFSSDTTHFIKAFKKGDLTDAAKYYNALHADANRYYYELAQLQKESNKTLGKEQKAGLASFAKENHLSLQARQATQSEFNNLSFLDQQRFFSLSKRQQATAYQDSLLGPHGMRDYLEGKTKLQIQWDARFDKQFNDSFNKHWRIDQAQKKKIHDDDLARWEKKYGAYNTWNKKLRDQFDEDCKKKYAQNDAWNKAFDKQFDDNFNKRYAQLQTINTMIASMHSQGILKGNIHPTALSAAPPKGTKLHAGGLPRVPYDDYEAILHKDEMVISAAMAHAARAQAGHGVDRQHLVGGSRETFTVPYAQLTKDAGWLRYEDMFRKLSSSISNIESDIHKTEKHLREDKTKADKAKDTAILAALNAALRQKNAQTQAVQQAYHKAIARNVLAAGDVSGGEDTLVGVTGEKALLTKMRTAAGKGRKQWATGRYITGAAERGINVGLIHEITGRNLTATQQTAYKRLEAAEAPSAHTSSQRMKQLEQALSTSLGVTKAGGGLDRQQTYQDKHVQHMSKVESQLSSLVSKETVVNVVNRVTGGASISTIQRPGRKKAK